MKSRNNSFWAFLGICIVTVGCAHIEVEQIPYGANVPQQGQGGAQLLALTQPAWEVALDSGESDPGSKKATFRQVNVRDPGHIYQVRLVRGWFAEDTLSLRAPGGAVTPSTCVTAPGEFANKAGAGEPICAEMITPAGGFPDDSQIVDRFRRTGRRVFMFIIPEPEWKALSSRK